MRTEQELTDMIDSVSHDFTCNKKENTMHANKVTVNITIESLSIECLGGLVMQVIEQVDVGNEDGMLRANDGDVVTWETKRAKVEF